MGENLAVLAWCSLVLLPLAVALALTLAPLLLVEGLPAVVLVLGPLPLSLVEGLVVCSLAILVWCVLILLLPAVALVVALLMVPTLPDALGWTTGWRNRAGTSVGRGGLKGSRACFFPPLSLLKSPRFLLRT